MNKKLTYIILSLLCVCATNNLGAKTTAVKFKNNEKWWGFYVNDSPSQPFMQPFSETTNQYKEGGGFTKAVMLSSEGRYMWCADEAQVRFTGDSLVVKSASEVKINKGGRNLREAFLVCCHKNFPPSNKLPSSELITSIVYETSSELGFEQDQQSLLAYAKRLKEEGYPTGVIVLGNGWRNLSGSCDFNKQLYPDAKAMVETLHKMGFKLMLTYTPLITPVGVDYMNLRDKNLLLKNKRGTVQIVRNDAGYQACVNIALSEASSMLKSEVDYLRDMYNIDGFRYDASAVLPFLNNTGAKDAFMREWLSFGKSDRVKEYMPGLMDKFMVHVNCFEDNTPISYKTLNARINNLISSALCGYGYTHSLISKSVAEAAYEDELLMAYYLQLAAFMPVCSVDFAPWRVEDEKLRERIKQMYTIRSSISEFLNKALDGLGASSEPIIRNMEYQFPRLGYSDCINQFMFIDKYMVVLPEQNSSKTLVRFPRGVWKSAKGEIIKGPIVKSISAEKGQILYFELTN
ncbi:MAG: glycoside hydrolase family 31 protein [Rikenellaceae bacterium]